MTLTEFIARVIEEERGVVPTRPVPEKKDATPPETMSLGDELKTIKKRKKTRPHYVDHQGCCGHGFSLETHLIEPEHEHLLWEECH